MIRLLVAALLFGSVLVGEDITLPLDDGNILVRAVFIRVNEFGAYVPELAIKIKNQTSSPWSSLNLQFDMGGVCNGEIRQWSRTVLVGGLGYYADEPVVKEINDLVVPLVGKVDGCKTEIIKAKLLYAESRKVRIDGVTGKRVDLEKELQEIKAKRDAEAAAQAEADQKAAEIQAAEEARQARLAAAEDARRKRLAAEQKRKQAEAAAKYAKLKAEEEAHAAEERRRIREACASVYKKTVDKKVSGLTVGEEQQVRACQALGLYY